MQQIALVRIVGRSARQGRRESSGRWDCVDRARTITFAGLESVRAVGGRRWGSTTRSVIHEETRHSSWQIRHYI